MATFKKSKLKRAQDGISADYKERQGNYPKESQEGKGPSSDYRERQGQKTEGKTPPNKFPEAKVPETKKAETFGEAFKAARAAGKSIFTWNGKSYTTKTKEEAAKATSKAAPKAEAKPAAKAPEKKAEPTKTTGGAGPMNPVKDQRGGFKNTPERQKVIDAANKKKEVLTRSGKVYQQKFGGKTKKK